MSKSRPIKFIQNILEGQEPELNRPVPCCVINEADLGKSDVLHIFDHALPLGISPGFSETGRLVALAIADAKECRIIEFASPKRGQKKAKKISQDLLGLRKQLQQTILCRPSGDLLAFDMGPLCLALHVDLGIRVSNAVDIQSSFSTIDRKPITAIETAFGDSLKMNPENIRSSFLYPIYNDQDSYRRNDLFMRAWVSQFIASFRDGILLFANAKRIDTNRLSDQHLAMISKLATDSIRLDQKKPMQTGHHITQAQTTDVADSGEQVQLQSNNYTTRLRRDRVVQMTASTAEGPITLSGVVEVVSGRTGHISSSQNIFMANKEVVTVTSIGRDDPTTAEAKRAAIVLQILQGQEKLLDTSPWINNIWFINTPDTDLSWPMEWSQISSTTFPKLHSSKPHKSTQHRVLNSSQQTSVNAMLSEQDDYRITIIQGPPGTGKTSVISSFVQFSIQFKGRSGIWLVAQSNVAVKNIAEKLFADGFTDWKLLVSKDFRFDWHDHLYAAELQSHIIQSDQFTKMNSSKLQGVKVILCTLSMLSNTRITVFTKVNPLHTLVVDEASQIEIGDYIPVFSAFKHSLRKVCFIGDDRQLPPFGQEDVEDLQSIFEVTHLKKLVLFLDTQYRMPPQIGEILSEAVYDGHLKSNPKHPITDKVTACHFFDIASGRERQPDGKSFMNELEAQAVLKLAKKLQENGKSYRIITPYEAQRSYIEESMKLEGLEWGDKCFNVDSFQGNEDDYIVISVVRNREIGFLKNLRRTNVMLSRCKKGMFIFSSQQFLTGPGKDTLVGTLLVKMGNTWLNESDIDGKDFFLILQYLFVNI